MRASDEDLAGASFHQVGMTGARFRLVDLAGARFEQVDLTGVVMRGVELVDVDITGEIGNLTVKHPVSRVTTTHARRWRRSWRCGRTGWPPSARCCTSSPRRR